MGEGGRDWLATMTVLRTQRKQHPVSSHALPSKTLARRTPASLCSRPAGGCS